MSESYIIVETCRYEGVQKIHLLLFRDKDYAESRAAEMNVEMWEDLVLRQRDYIRSIGERISGATERDLLRIEVAEAELREMQTLGVSSLTVVCKVLTLQDAFR